MEGLRNSNLAFCADFASGTVKPAETGGLTALGAAATAGADPPPGRMLGLEHRRPEDPGGARPNGGVLSSFALSRHSVLVRLIRLQTKEVRIDEHLIETRIQRTCMFHIALRFHVPELYHLFHEMLTRQQVRTRPRPMPFRFAPVNNWALLRKRFILRSKHLQIHTIA